MVLEFLLQFMMSRVHVQPESVTGIALIGHVASKFVLLTLSGHMHLENNACVLYACMDYFNTVCVCVMMAHCCSCYTQDGETALDRAKYGKKHDVVTYLEEIGKCTE